MCLELQCEEDLDGILQVLVWKVEEQVSEVEFYQLYREWFSLRNKQDVSE